MALLDWIVIALFFVALIGIIVWVMRQKQNNAADYFLGGKDATWIAIGASIFASTSVRSTSSALPAPAHRAAWPWHIGKYKAG